MSLWKKSYFFFKKAFVFRSRWCNLNYIYIFEMSESFARLSTHKTTNSIPPPPSTENKSFTLLAHFMYPLTIAFHNFYSNYKFLLHKVLYFPFGIIMISQGWGLGANNDIICTYTLLSTKFEILWVCTGCTGCTLYFVRTSYSLQVESVLKLPWNSKFELKK